MLLVLKQFTLAVLVLLLGLLLHRLQNLLDHRHQQLHRLTLLDHRLQRLLQLDQPKLLALMLLKLHP